MRVAVCALAWVTWLHPSAALAEPSPAQRPAETAARERASTSHVTLGLNVVGGGLFSSERSVAGGGGALLAAYALVPERWELELGVSLLGAHDVGPLAVAEVIAKRIFETEGRWAPYVLVGPLLSLDFGHELKSSGGLVAGGGVAYWFDAQIGVAAEGAYRLLIGREVEHVLSASLGLRLRL